MALNTLAVTRPVGEGKDTAQFISELGWNPLIVHTVELKSREPSEILSEFKDLLVGGPPDWLVFMSPRGVHLTMNALNSQSEILSSIGSSTNIVAIGPKTREAIVAHGYSDVLLPESYSSTGIATFFSKFSAIGKRIVLARFAEADDSLADSLASKGALVRTVPLYSIASPRDQSSVTGFLKALNENQVKGVLFTSSLSATNLLKIGESVIESGKIQHLLQTCVVGAIGPITAKKLEELGIRAEIVPGRYLISEAVRLIIRAFRSREKNPTWS